MRHLNRGFSETEQIHNSQPSISTDEATSPNSNVLMGIVISKTEGLTRTTLRIRVGEHTDLRDVGKRPSPHQA